MTKSYNLPSSRFEMVIAPALACVPMERAMMVSICAHVHTSQMCAVGAHYDGTTAPGIALAPPCHVCPCAHKSAHTSLRWRCTLMSPWTHCTWMSPSQKRFDAQYLDLKYSWISANTPYSKGNRPRFEKVVKQVIFRAPPHPQLQYTRIEPTNHVTLPYQQQ